MEAKTQSPILIPNLTSPVIKIPFKFCDKYMLTNRVLMQSKSTSNLNYDWIISKAYNNDSVIHVYKVLHNHKLLISWKCSASISEIAT